MAKEINVLVVEPGKAPRPAKVKNTLETFSEIVGGPVEAGCYLPQRVMLMLRQPKSRCGTTGRKSIFLSTSRRSWPPERAWATRSGLQSLT